MASPSEETDLTSLPADPLLQPGSFIIDGPSSEPQPDSADLSTPINNNNNNNKNKKKNKKKKKDTPPSAAAAAAAAAAVPEATPSWLPEGWKMVSKVRESGATAGSIDRYYFEPTSGSRLRSRVEVEYFLRTGMKKKRSIPPADGADNVQPTETPEVGKQKKSRKGSKKSRPHNFDFEDVPEMVTWQLTDASNDHWMPFIDNKMVSSQTKQEWDFALQSLTSGKSETM